MKSTLSRLPYAIGLTFAAIGCGGDPTDTALPTTQPPPTDTDVVDTDTDTDIVDTDTHPPTPDVDCSVAPTVPYALMTGQNFGTAEDFDFDQFGRHVSVRDNNLVARALDGTQTLLAPNVGFETACTRMLPDGNFIICNVATGTVDLLDFTSQSRSQLMTGLSYPNGGEVDPQGRIYVAEQTAGRVQRYDPATGTSTVIATGLNAPNGVIWGPDYEKLYVGSFGFGTIWELTEPTPGNWETRVFAQNPNGSGEYDGINVDECGNVYITEYVAGLVIRLSPEGTDPAVVATLPSFWIPNMRWGNGQGGTDEGTLYVSDRSAGRLFALNAGGLRGKEPLPIVP